MSVLDLSRTPCSVVITNSSTKDQKINISGYSQSFILPAGASVELQAKNSSDLIGYLSQLRPGLKVNFPGLPGLGLIPCEFTTVDPELFSDDMAPEAAVIQGPPFGLVEGQHYMLTYTIDGGEEIQLHLWATAQPISETESILLCVAVGEPPIYIFDADVIPLEERAGEEHIFRVNPEVGSFVFYHNEGGSVVNLLSFEAIDNPNFTISTTVAGCTLTIVDADSNVYNNLDTVPYGTELTITAVADEEGHVIDSFTINGVLYDDGNKQRSITYTVRGDVEIVLYSQDPFLDLSIDATGCTVVVEGDDAYQTRYNAGTNKIPKGTTVTITVTPEAGYSADGMVITADGNAINSGDTIQVNGDLAIVATATT